MIGPAITEQLYIVVQKPPIAMRFPGWLEFEVEAERPVSRLDREACP
jgi:hypothetical protein